METRGKSLSLKGSAQVSLLLSLLIALTLTTSSCGGKTLSGEQSRNLDKALDTLIERMELPGAVVGIWVPGQGEWVVARGKADFKTGRKLSTADKFRIGSLTKAFTTTVVLQLVDEGKINLGDTISSYVEGVPAGDDIILRQLCNNTSGLFNYGDDETFNEAISSNPKKKWAPKDLVDIAASHPTYFEPGQGFHYSNTNFILLGMVIEKATGNTAAEEIDERIVKPLGLKHTYLPDTMDMTGRYAHGYLPKVDKNDEIDDVTEYIDPSIVWTAGAMVSDLYDLKIWTEALGTGKLISKKLFKEQKDWIEIPGEKGIRKYGLGMFATGPLIGHDGMQPGYNSSAFYLPDNGAVFVSLVNMSGDETMLYGLSMTMAFAMVLFPDKVPW